MLNPKLIRKPRLGRGALRGCLVAALLVAAVTPLTARDWPEPYRTIDPYALLQPGEPGAVFDWEFNPQVFRGSDHDAFQLNLVGGAGLFRIGDRFAAGMRYGTYLMNGPSYEGSPGTPHGALDWLINAIQFEYGLHLAYDLNGFRLLGEYSRASQHPFEGRDDVSSDVSYDRVAVGIGAPRVPFGDGGMLTAAARIAYVDLWDAWDHRTIGKPRTQWMLRTGVLATYPLTDGFRGRFRPHLLAELHPDFFTQRGDRPDAVLAARAGLRLTDDSTPRVIDLYFDAYLSADSEKMAEEDREESPVALLGIGIRIGNASAH